MLKKKPKGKRAPASPSPASWQQLGQIHHKASAERVPGCDEDDSHKDFPGMPDNQAMLSETVDDDSTKEAGGAPDQVMMSDPEKISIKNHGLLPSGGVELLHSVQLQ